MTSSSLIYVSVSGSNLRDAQSEGAVFAYNWPLANLPIYKPFLEILWPSLTLCADKDNHNESNNEDNDNENKHNKDNDNDNEDCVCLQLITGQCPHI